VRWLKYIIVALFAGALFASLQLILYSPCDSPIEYKIGMIDSRFGLSSQEVIADVTQATSLWSNVLGKQLFVSSPKALLSVNFVYDQRQALNSQIQTLQDQLKAKDNTLQQQLATYYQQANAFEEKLAALNSEIDAWNKKGGAPQDVYAQLLERQKALQIEGDNLNATARSLKLSTTDYNSGVGTLNQDIHQFNSVLSQKPEEGLYNGNTNTITIYFSSSHLELIHTLTHEFGHSLGMEHVHDPQAIMYPFTTENIVPSDQDVIELTRVCRKRPILFLWVNTLAKWTRSIWLHGALLLPLHN